MHLPDRCQRCGSRITYEMYSDEYQFIDSHCDCAHEKIYVGDEKPSILTEKQFISAEEMTL